MDETGVHKDLFNLKQKGLQFYIDAARIFALSHNLKGINNTFLRFKQMSIIDTKNAEKYLDFAENYIKLQEFRTKEGVLNDNDGAFIDTNKLSKIDKEELKKAVADIFENETDAKNIIKYKEVLASLDKASDKCKAVARVLEAVAVKHS